MRHHWIQNTIYRIASYPPRLRIVGAPYTIPRIMWNIPILQIVGAAPNWLVRKVASFLKSPSCDMRSDRFRNIRNKEC